jgi:phosphate transport system substrate-binding protein
MTSAEAPGQGRDSQVGDVAGPASPATALTGRKVEKAGSDRQQKATDADRSSSGGAADPSALAVAAQTRFFVAEPHAKYPVRAPVVRLSLSTYMSIDLDIQTEANMERLATTLAALAFASTAHAAETTGAGSTFVYPIIANWAASYKAKTGNRVNYMSVGSGAGIMAIKNAAVDFGASDIPMKPDELQKLGLCQFPLVVGGVVPVVNVEGIKPGQLRFSGPVLAGIFSGKIKTWNDPALQALNGDIPLPAEPITVAHQSDSSGTTFNWVKYLSKVSPEWRDQVGEGANVRWPVGVAGRGNDGIAALVTTTRFSIGYVEYSYAVQNKLAYGLVQNKAGWFVKPDIESFEASLVGVDWRNAPDFYVNMIDAPLNNAYPITAPVFILMYKQPKNLERAIAALDFFKWLLESRQTQAESLDYVPLPAPLIKGIEAYWKAQIVGWTG